MNYTFLNNDHDRLPKANMISSKPRATPMANGRKLTAEGGNPLGKPQFYKYIYWWPTRP